MSGVGTTPALESSVSPKARATARPGEHGREEELGRKTRRGPANGSERGGYVKYTVGFAYSRASAGKLANWGACMLCLHSLLGNAGAAADVTAWRAGGSYPPMLGSLPLGFPFLSICARATLPPAAWMRAISRRLPGLWSLVSSTAAKDPSLQTPMTARESPAHAATTLRRKAGAASEHVGHYGRED